ncbi:tRNA (cmo5U34)-methyltransferase [uncultured archaeon]|nr:tRNA (cmo5U34)-methyltransferase [uncultured archaeon]
MDSEIICDASEEKTMTEDTTVSCYDDHAQAYDAYQFAAVPGYREMLDLAAEAARRYLSPDARIIDLGCGTGNASLAVLGKMPSARIFLLDGSERMVSVAREKISSAHPRAILGYRVADLAENWAEGLESEGYDCIVSTLVLEHLPLDRYRRAIEECFRLLKPGGWLIASEGYAEEGSDMREWFFQEMEVRRRALDPKLSDFVAGLRGELEQHYYTSKARKAQWWQEAGFCSSAVLWQYLCIALMAGRKPL